MLRRLRRSDKAVAADIIEQIINRIFIIVPIVGLIILMFALFTEDTFGALEGWMEDENSFEYGCQNTEWYWNGCQGEIPIEVMNMASSMLGVSDGAVIREKCDCG